MSDYTNIIQEINTNIPDNTDQSITALKVRTTLIDMLDAVDDNMTEAIGEISVPTYTSDLTNDSGFITATSLEPYVTKTELSNASYVTQNELNSASYVTESQLQQAGYVTQSALNSMSYATTAFVDDAIADAFEDSDFMTETDVNNLLSTASYITESEIATMGYVTSAQLSSMSYVTNQYLAETLSSATYVTESQLQQAGYVTSTDLNNYDFATETYVADYVASHSGPIDLSAYVSKDELSQAGYVTSNDLNNYDFATETYVADYVASHSGPIDLSSYVTKDELSNASYATTTQLNEAISGIAVPTKTSDLTNDSGFITSSALSGLATETYVNSQISSAISEIEIPTKTSDLTNDSGFITSSDLSEYATETYVADYVAQHAPTPDLSAYVSKVELSNMGYITASDVSQMGYITASDLPDMSSYATLTYLETYYATLQNVSDTADAMQQVLIDANILVTDPETGDWTTQVMASETYVVDYVAQHAPTPDLSAYVTKDELSQAGYVTGSEISSMGYMTQSDLSNMSYVTQSALNNASYATTSQLATKQDTLVSGTNIKTVNNNSLLGSGNITISSSGNLIAEVTQAEYSAMQQAGTLDPNTIYVITDAPATDLSYYAELTYVDTYYVSKEQLNSASYVTASALSNMSYATTSQLSNKQDNLVSGTNIKTINNESLLGSGNITISGGSGEANVIESISVNGTTQTVTNKNVDITVPTNTNQLTNGAGFLTSAIFQYNSSTYTLTISI